MLGVVDVQWVDQDTHRQGFELWINLGRRYCSLVDCISYIIMNRLQVEKAFCFKSNYADQGLTLLPEQISPLRRANSKS
jgi:predicted nucleic acid-binding protein